jgi:hypothetical protein
MQRNSEWDVIVVGGINTDYLIFGKTLPRQGQTVEGAQVSLPRPEGAQAMLAKIAA